MPLIFYKTPMKLSLFFTKKCNFNCDYCYLGKKSNQTITYAKFYKVIDFFLSLPSKEKEITYMGGEPLLETDFLRKSAIRIKKIAEQKQKKITMLHLMTNGFLLSKEKFDLLKSLGISFTVSLDGKKESNNMHRKSDNKKFFFERILENLHSIPLREYAAGNSLVFGPDNVSQLYENFIFTANLGFAGIYFLPRAYEKWNNDDLKILKFNLRKIVDYYVSLFKSADRRRIFCIPYLGTYIEKKKSRSFCCDKINMDWQGNIYRCWAFLSLSDEERRKHRLDISDFSGSNKMFEKKFFIPAVNLFEKMSAQDVSDSSFCPVDNYVHSILYNEDPRKAMRNFIKINNIYKNFFSIILNHLGDNLLFRKINKINRK